MARFWHLALARGEVPLWRLGPCSSFVIVGSIVGSSSRNAHAPISKQHSADAVVSRACESVLWCIPRSDMDVDLADIDMEELITKLLKLLKLLQLKKVDLCVSTEHCLSLI